MLSSSDGRQHRALSTKGCGLTICGTYQVDDDATPEDIKAAYRYLAKQCHPDQRGDIGHDMCVLLNEVRC